jgi:hypothetical protein
MGCIYSRNRYTKISQNSNNIKKYDIYKLLKTNINYDIYLKNRRKNKKDEDKKIKYYLIIHDKINDININVLIHTLYYPNFININYNYNLKILYFKYNNIIKLYDNNLYKNFEYIIKIHNIDNNNYISILYRNQKIYLY